MRYLIVNGLSVTRIVIGAVFLLIGVVPAGWLFVLIFFAGAMSDLLDGYFARRWDVTSNVGKLLDVISDKLFAACFLWVIGDVSPSVRIFWYYYVIAYILIAFVTWLRQRASPQRRAPTLTAKAAAATHFVTIAIGLVWPHSPILLAAVLGAVVATTAHLFEAIHQSWRLA